MGIRQLPNGKWRLQVRRKGWPTVDRVFITKAEAEAAAATLPDRTHQPLDRGEVTLTEAWERYCASREFDAKAENTQATERCRIQPVLIALGSYSLANLGHDTSIIEDYIDRRTGVQSERTGRKLSPSSVRLEVAALSAVVEFAKKRRLVHSNFVRGIDRPITKKRKRRVPKTEQGRLQLAAHSPGSGFEKPARFTLLLRILGCRPSELANLRVDDLNLTDRDALFRDTKNGTDRRIHIMAHAAGLLRAQLEDMEDEGAPYVFATRGRDKEWKPYNYSGAIKTLRTAGIIAPDCHAHAMRREFISRAIEAGIPYATIRKQTGHKSTQAIEIYDEGLPTADDQRRAWDTHAEVIKKEQLYGALEAAGLKGDELEEVIAKLELRKPNNGWQSFDDASAQKGKASNPKA